MRWVGVGLKIAEWAQSQLNYMINKFLSVSGAIDVGCDIRRLSLYRGGGPAIDPKNCYY